jgi:putative FmdB family regulatory protein
MPLYEYECSACGRRFELIRKFSDPPVDVCTLCGKGPINRLFSSPAIQFKGSGFYITDYAKKGDSGSTETSKSDGSASKAKGDKTAASEAGSGDTSKSESKSDTAAKPESSGSAPPAKSSGPAKD